MAAARGYGLCPFQRARRNGQDRMAGLDPGDTFWNGCMRALSSSSTEILSLFPRPVFPFGRQWLDPRMRFIPCRYAKRKTRVGPIRDFFFRPTKESCARGPLSRQKGRRFFFPIGGLTEFTRHARIQSGATEKSWVDGFGGRRVAGAFCIV